MITEDEAKRYGAEFAEAGRPNAAYFDTAFRALVDPLSREDQERMKHAWEQGWALASVVKEAEEYGDDTYCHSVSFCADCPFYGTLGDGRYCTHINGQFEITSGAVPGDCPLRVGKTVVELALW